MKSITQIDQEKETHSLISAFIQLIGLKKLSRKVNFKRKSQYGLIWLVSYLAGNALFQAFALSYWQKQSR